MNAAAERYGSRRIRCSYLAAVRAEPARLDDDQHGQAPRRPPENARPQRFEPHMLPQQEFGGAPLYFAVQQGEPLVVETEAGIEFPTAPAAGRQHVLGSLDNRPCIAIDVDGDEPPVPMSRVGLRRLHGLVSEVDWSLASRAVQIVAWDRNHRFCGRCRTPTEPQPAERARRCPSCGLSAYPRLTPAVIALVTRGEHDQQALLAWGRRHRGRHYSTLAGFVEVGEGLEEAVRREIREETAIEVTDIAYFGSQPWPFPSQLMVGFRARYASGEIEAQESEIVEARWFTADEVERVTASRGSFSIAGWLIDGWLAERRARPD
jgi:NAD+ diphosphatase